MTGTLRGLVGCAVALTLAAGAVAQEPSRQDTPLAITRAAGDITIDGELSEPAWREAEPAEVWYEINPGDNVEPKVANTAYLLYDDKYFYAGFEFADPEPEKIRAPLGDRDNLPGYTDYGGVILDANNDGKTAQMFLANARGIRYDAITSDVTGEDSSPDFFWDAAGNVNGNGWTLEIRVPLSSIRYSAPDWRVLLYRNRPRDFRYQIFTSKLPRDVNCFICNARPIVGLADLPTGGHYIIAPVAVATQLSEPEGDLGTPLRDGGLDFEPSIDVKWIPNPNTVIDATVNPDFSQIESDVAQISANERFALFFPEKRPFFLEGIDLFRTPIRAVYSRTFNSPDWGGRATGKIGKNAYTFLTGQDAGGGSVILPGPSGSDLADQDFESLVAMGRWRRDMGKRSFVSFLFTGREIDGGGSNRVFGPDFEWRPNDNDRVVGQVLFSRSETPNLPDLAEEWNGQELEGHALEAWWAHGTDKEDWFVLYEDYGDDFRADNGFVPRVGYREGFGEFGYTFRQGRGLPKEGFLTRLRAFTWFDQSEDREGNLLNRQLTVGTGMDGRWNSFWQVRLQFDEVESDGELFSRTQLRYFMQLSPSKAISQISLNGYLGDDVDFANSRPADGGQISLRAALRPSDHLELIVNADRRWLDVDTGGGGDGRLFTAQVARLRGVYTFNSKMWVRLIGQYVETERDPALYIDEVDDKSGGFSGSLVFAYKLNWQSVLFVGYGDDRELDELDHLERSSRQLFLKVSYAFQR